MSDLGRRHSQSDAASRRRRAVGGYAAWCQAKRRGTAVRASLVEIGNAGRRPPPDMGSIQVALCDQSRADALCSLLARSTPVPVLRVECPDFESACVVVLDAARFASLSGPLVHPERVVLIAPKDAGHLGAAWEAGVNSVLSEQDPLKTVVLAVLATCLRAGALKPKSVGDRQA